MIFSTELFEQGNNIVAFADSPIVIAAEMTAGDMVSGASLHHVVFKVTIGESLYEFSAAFSQGETIPMDISSAFTSEYMHLDRQSEPKPTDGGYNVLSGKVEAYVKYVKDGEEHTGPSSVVVPLFYVLRGGVPNRMRRMFSNPSVAVEHYKNRLSTKPQYEVCNLGDTHIISTYDEAAHSVKTQRTKLTSVSVASSISDTAITIENNANRKEFFFRNKLGVIESVSACALESKKQPMSSERYKIIAAPSFTPGTTVMTKAATEPEQYELSSGYVTEEWARWWIEDFLASEFHWMRTEMNGEEIFVPCHVELSSSDVELYDKTDNALYEVVFKAEAFM